MNNKRAGKLGGFALATIISCQCLAAGFQATGDFSPEIYEDTASPIDFIDKISESYVSHQESYIDEDRHYEFNKSHTDYGKYLRSIELRDLNIQAKSLFNRKKEDLFGNKYVRNSNLKYIASCDKPTEMYQILQKNKVIGYVFRRYLEDEDTGQYNLLLEFYDHNQYLDSLSAVEC